MNDAVRRAIEFCENRHPPTSLEITNICSAKCSFCWYGKGGDWRKPGHVSQQVLERFLFLLDKHSVGGEVVNLSTAHGDVLTNKQLPEIIRKITSVRNVEGVPFFTNGILLHRFDLDELFSLKIHHANFSTSIANEEQFKRLYGKDSYRQTFSNIIRFLKKNNERGRRKIPVRVLLRVDKPFEKIRESEDYKIVKRLIGEYRISFLEKWDDYNGLIKASDLPRGGHRFKEVEPIAHIPCYALYRKLEVLKDGEITCCTCRLSKDLVIGSIWDTDTLDEIWRGKSLKRLRQDWMKGVYPSICSSCSHFQPVTALYKTMKRSRNFVLKHIDLVFRKVGLSA